jgi:hypothetical protein
MNRTRIPEWSCIGVLVFALVAIGRGPRQEPVHATTARAAASEVVRVIPAAAPERAREASAARWRRLSAAPATIARDAELAEILGESLERDLESAADLWAQLPETDRMPVSAALLWDAASDPPRAVTLTQALCRIDGAGTLQHGNALLAALLRYRHHAAAIDFVRTAATALPLGEEPAKWVRALFAGWASREPLRAASAAAGLSDESLRGETLGAVANLWWQRDPQAAGAFVASLPPGATRTSVLAAIPLR